MVASYKTEATNVLTKLAANFARFYFAQAAAGALVGFAVPFIRLALGQ